ncbi:hypothetical protein NQ315_004032 [Exocentrus adspersus]|uniref:Pro-resilin n=1 Tax=Exocentrus adspersus TaxID=1586481 RepID=A0AAV8W7T7_9CUCU|nr:hypothetical protein NQ315_004032 [Exocentrus adspersus]
MVVRKVTFTLICACVSVIRGEPPSNSYGTPLGAPINSYGTPNLQGNGDHEGHDSNGEPKSYEFGYQVKDDYTGTNYNRKEASDGNQVRGEYRVALPDGRTQIVTYWADWQSGFHADVRYEGEAQYPDQPNKGGYGNGNGGYNGGGGYSNGGYSNGVSNEYGAPSFGGGYSASASSNTLAINSLANDHAGDYNFNGYSRR